MQNKILLWFATGRVGVSSRAMASVLTGLPVNKSFFGNHPHDPDDLNRCLLFLKAVPEARDHLDKIAAISDVWKKLVDNWEVLEKTFLEEVGLDWCKGHKASKTYDLMKKLGC